MTLTKQNIESLLVLCQDGNQLAQLEVYNRYQRAMYNTALRIVKDIAEAEDVMQESFLTAFQKLDTYKGEASFGAWLKRIVVNNSIAQFRKAQRISTVSDENIPLAADEANDGLDAEDYAQVQVSQLMETMNELHHSYRQILSLHFVEGFDYEEICQIMDISYANCRTMISRAKESLRKKLIIHHE
ncbi:RNA polymerase subunit sigma [Aureitalea marina]|uniref:RNA polymerase subunit sigma n=1 Tax=Aureitalea marina TaxID=930804 RepID=A0A2S7KTK1_9FLAO|nr:RNA polymerase sigma factor [Aureitalea marina]PQB05962.1 RNA polymerase subunit sigma [Aureitalea marina]